MARENTIAMFGEAMVEISGKPLTKCYGGGDVLNTAIYLLRLDRKYSSQAKECNGLFNIQFITALGDDSLSEDLILAWNQEG